MANKDAWATGSLSKKSIREHITPHKISIVILIQEYCNLKTEAYRLIKLKELTSPMNNTVKMPDPCYTRSFCMLILHLIQCPDMDFAELVALLQSKKLLPNLLQHFLAEVEAFKDKEVGSIMDVILNLGRLLIDTGNNMPPIVNKSSPIGVYLRRVMLYFDKLNFSQTVSLFRGFQMYVLQGKQVQANQVKDELFTPPNTVMPVSAVSVDASMCDSAMESVSMEMSSAPIPFPCLLHGHLTSGIKKDIVKVEECEGGEVQPALWSRRQAELFISRQSACLQNNESSALPPSKMQDIICKVLKANPDHYEAHYLSYLNCLRVKELGGAIDSLYHYFDRNAVTNQDKDVKGYRYAALNLATLHAHFGHRNEALAALKEAFWLSHEVNDNTCLQHAQAWLYKLTEDSREILMERSISKCSEMSLNYLTSLGLQSFAQFAGHTGGKPALVFEVLIRSDVLNCQFSLLDMMAHSLAQKAALWTLYGKADMAALASQLLLHLDSAASLDAVSGLNAYSGEPTCQAICNVALRLTDLGEYDMALVVLDHARTRFPQSSEWQLSEQLLFFTRSVFRGQWQAAHNAVRQIATFDKWESLLRLGQLLLAKGDEAGALSAVAPVADATRSVATASVRVRALLLSAKASPSIAITALTAALTLSNYHYLDYLTSLLAMQLAQVQVEMGLPNQALKLMDHSLLSVLSHGGYYDQAAALLLFVQCKVASVVGAEHELRSEVIADAIRLLAKVRDNFQRVEAYAKVKEAIYLQSLMANELGCYAERNKFAYEFRQLDEEFPTLIHV